MPDTTSTHCRIFTLGCALVLLLASIVFHHESSAQESVEKLIQDKPEDIDKSFILAQQDYDSRITPILKNACFDCHEGDGSESDVDLASYTSVQSIIDQQETWKAIRKVIDNHTMPPEGVEMDQADRKEVLKFIDSLFYKINCESNRKPGSVTIRRLSRYEYQNTIRDLLDVEYLAVDRFPADEVGYGFDNIGDVLSLSPIHFENYLAAAETISEQAVFDIRKIKTKFKYDGVEFRGDESAPSRSSDRVLTTRNIITLVHENQLEGDFKFRIDAFEDPAGDEHAEMSLVVDGVAVADFEVSNRAKRRKRYSVNVQLPARPVTIGISFNNDYYNPSFPEREFRDRNLVIRALHIEGPEDFSEEQLPTHARGLSELAGRKKELDNREIRTFINQLGSRAFRRKLTSEEITSLKSIYDQGQENGLDIFQSMQLTVQAMLVSPSFLFRIEHPVDSAKIRDLTDFELATSLSYFLWSSMPDLELFRIAYRGELNNDEMLRKQIKRMLADPKSKALVDNFAVQWLQLRILDEFEPDPELFASFDADLRQAMITETKQLFADIVQQDLPVDHLLSTDYTYLNERLAKHYEISNVEGDHFRKVDIKPYGRGGLLTHGSFLTLTSNPTRTSPVKRGKWVLENLLAQPPPPPLPDVAALDNQAELTGTLRERMSQHSANPSCAVCHDQLDPLGFALEKFDAIGRFRVLDDGKPIDDSGELPDGSKFSGANELTELLLTKQKTDFHRCVVEKLMIYSLGRGIDGSDDCLLNEITASSMEGKNRFSDIITAIVLSDAFRKRSSDSAND